MPTVNISGTKLVKVDHVSFSMSGGGGEVHPMVSCSFSLPATDQTTLVDWMLTKQSPDRYKKVVVETLDKDGKVDKTWTLHKCYIASYSEAESGMGHDTSISCTLIGVLASNTEYTGKNIVEVKAGVKETTDGV